MSPGTKSGASSFRTRDGGGGSRNSGERAGGPLARAWLVEKLRLEEAMERTSSS